MMGGGSGLVGSPDQQSGIMKASPLAKRIAKPPQGPMVPQR